MFGVPAIYGARASEPAEVTAEGDHKPTIAEQSASITNPTKQTDFVCSLNEEHKSQFYSAIQPQNNKTMANTLTDLKDIKIAQSGLMPWMATLLPLRIDCGLSNLYRRVPKAFLWGQSAQQTKWGGLNRRPQRLASSTL